VPFFGYFLWASKESDSPARDGGRSPTGTKAASVAQRQKAKSLGSRFRGNDETKPGMTKQNEERKWIPAFAGMTEGGFRRNDGGEQPTN
jgi:hypothetical protein